MHEATAIPALLDADAGEDNEHRSSKAAVGHRLAGRLLGLPHVVSGYG